MLFIQQDYQWPAVEQKPWGYISKICKDLAAVVQMNVASHNRAEMYPRANKDILNMAWS